MSEAIEWVTVNLPGRVTVGEDTAPCQIVTISIEGLVILPTFKGQPGMIIGIELHPHDRPAPIRVTGVVAREGAYHGNYALQVQYGEDVTAEAEAAILRLLGYEVEEPVAGGDRLAVDESGGGDRGLRSYNQVLADLPEMEVDDVTPARFEDDTGDFTGQKDRDLFKEVKEVNEASLKKIYREAIREMSDSGKKKKKGWFG